MSSFKSNENIHKKEDGSYYVVSAKVCRSDTCKTIHDDDVFRYVTDYDVITASQVASNSS